MKTKVVMIGVNEYSIPVEVNSRPVKAFVDSGAQQTISKFSLLSDCYIYRRSFVALV